MNSSHLVTLISASNPQILERLREQHPAASEFLGAVRTRDLQGGTRNDEEVERSIADARRDLLLEGIKPLRAELKMIIDVVMKKIKKVKRTKLLGAIVATLSGLVIAVLEAAKIGEDWVKVMSAAFAMFGGLVVILSDYFAQTPSGKYIASAEEYGKLEQMSKELFKVERRVQRHALFPLSPEDVGDMIDSLEEYAAYIHSLTLNTAAVGAET